MGQSTGGLPRMGMRMVMTMGWGATHEMSCLSLGQSEPIGLHCAAHHAADSIYASTRLRGRDRDSLLVPVVSVVMSAACELVWEKKLVCRRQSMWQSPMECSRPAVRIHSAAPEVEKTSVPAVVEPVHRSLQFVFVSVLLPL